MEPPLCLVVLFLLIITASLPRTFSSRSTLTEGSFLSVEKSDNSLVSPNGNFTAGFHKVGSNAYCFAIWFTDPSCPANCTLVWKANRDNPVNERRSKLTLLKTGNLVLTDAGKLIAWSSDTNSSLPSLSLTLLDTGNLVLGSGTGVVVWQSFDFPTDTLLPSQEFKKDSTLVSSRSRTDISSGFYKLSFDESNVLRLVYDGVVTSGVFWPMDHSKLPRDVGRTTYNSSRTAVLDPLGNFSSSDNFSFVSSDYGLKIWRRLTLDFDGNLRLYSRDTTGGGSNNWVVSWQAISDTCKVHSACGPNGVCSYLPKLGTRTCSCLPGFKRSNTRDWSLGCEPEFDDSCVDENEAGYISLPYTESRGYNLDYLQNITFEDCKRYCSKRCDCKGFVFKFFYSDGPDNKPYCYPKSQLINGYRLPNFKGEFYVKVPKARNFSMTLEIEDSLICSADGQREVLDRGYGESDKSWSLNFLLWFVTGVGVFEVLAMLIVWNLPIRTNENDEEAAQVFLLENAGFKRFTYAELKKATRNFKEVIGRGASGIVYKGMLSNDRIAAIKKLYESEQGEAEFLAEVSTIGRLNHMHLIEMWGYCADGKHRILVYEYMEHGSLAENQSSNSLDWKKRFQIALGTAKGLAYLHEECLEWVLHCDLKPENILLDSNYRPKVSDFGLSKLLTRGGLDSSSFSRMRGTRGYMAPEWAYNLAISSKVDVYSYGVVVLEMVTGKSPIGITSFEKEGLGENGRMVDWLRQKVETEKSWVESVLDPIIVSNCAMDEVELLVKVALQCVEEDMNARPTMNQVVEMLLGQEV